MSFKRGFTVAGTYAYEWYERSSHHLSALPILSLAAPIHNLIPSFVFWHYSHEKSRMQIYIHIVQDCPAVEPTPKGKHGEKIVPRYRCNIHASARFLFACLSCTVVTVAIMLTWYPVAATLYVRVPANWSEIISMEYCKWRNAGWGLGTRLGAFGLRTEVNWLS